MGSPFNSKQWKHVSTVFPMYCVTVKLCLCIFPATNKLYTYDKHENVAKASQKRIQELFRRHFWAWVVGWGVGTDRLAKVILVSDSGWSKLPSKTEGTSLYQNYTPEESSQWVLSNDHCWSLQTPLMLKLLAFLISPIQISTERKLKTAGTRGK